MKVGRVDPAMVLEGTCIDVNIKTTPGQIS